MTMYRLHYFPESGNSYKLALMLTLCGQKFEPVWTDFGGRITQTAEWRQTVNEMGEIPVLEEEGLRISQTASILLRLAERYVDFAARTPTSASKSCAGCSGIITSSPAIWRHMPFFESSSFGRYHGQLEFQRTAALRTHDARGNFRHHVVRSGRGDELVNIEPIKMATALRDAIAL